MTVRGRVCNDLHMAERSANRTARVPGIDRRLIAANRLLTWKWRGASLGAENAFLRVLGVIAPAYLTARASRAENLQPWEDAEA